MPKKRSTLVLDDELPFNNMDLSIAQEDLISLRRGRHDPAPQEIISMGAKSAYKFLKGNRKTEIHIDQDIIEIAKNLFKHQTYPKHVMAPSSEDILKFIIFCEIFLEINNVDSLEDLCIIKDFLDRNVALEPDSRLRDQLTRAIEDMRGVIHRHEMNYISQLNYEERTKYLITLACDTGKDSLRHEYIAYAARLQTSIIRARASYKLQNYSLVQLQSIFLRNITNIKQFLTEELLSEKLPVLIDQTQLISELINNYWVHMHKNFEDKNLPEKMRIQLLINALPKYCMILSSVNKVAKYNECYLQPLTELYADFISLSMELSQNQFQIKNGTIIANNNIIQTKLFSKTLLNMLRVLDNMPQIIVNDKLTAPAQYFVELMLEYSSTLMSFANNLKDAHNISFESFKSNINFLEEYFIKLRWVYANCRTFMNNEDNFLQSIDLITIDFLEYLVESYSYRDVDHHYDIELINQKLDKLAQYFLTGNLFNRLLNVQRKLDDIHTNLEVKSPSDHDFAISNQVAINSIIEDHYVLKNEAQAPSLPKTPKQKTVRFSSRSPERINRTNSRQNGFFSAYSALAKDMANEALRYGPSLDMM